MKKIVRNYVVIPIGVWTFCVCLLFGILTIPKNDLWWKNFNKSYEEMHFEGDYPILLGGNGIQMWDNFTAAFFLNFLYHYDSNNPIKSGINMQCQVAKVPIIEDSVYTNCGALLSGDEVVSWNYSRYWGGHNIILYPFLFLGSVGLLRVFLLVTIVLLEVAFIHKKREKLVPFVLSMVMAHWLLNGMCIVYSIDIILSLLAINIWIYKRHDFIPEVYALILGGCTMFFCMLSNPLITLGMWLVVYISEKESQDHTVKKCIEILKISIFWTIGYYIMMELKGILAIAVGGGNTANSRMVELFGEGSILARIFMSIDIFYRFIYPWRLLLAICFVVYVVCILRFGLNKLFDLRLLLVAVYPFIWEIIFYGHTNHGIEQNLYVITLFALGTLLKNTIGEHD